MQVSLFMKASPGPTSFPQGGLQEARYGDLSLDLRKNSYWEYFAISSRFTNSTETHAGVEVPPQGLPEAAAKRATMTATNAANLMLLFGIFVEKVSQCPAAEPLGPYMWGWKTRREGAAPYRISLGCPLSVIKQTSRELKAKCCDRLSDCFGESWLC